MRIDQLRGAILQERECLHLLRDRLQHQPIMHPDGLHGQQRHVRVRDERGDSDTVCGLHERG
jgi:hypothetical protein